MFCSKCGTKLEEGADFCQKCGNSVSGGNQQVVYYNAPSESNGFAVAGFVLSFFIPLLGLIFSCIGCSKAKYVNSGKGLSIAGIILSVIFMIASIVMTIIILDNPHEFGIRW